MPFLLAEILNFQGTVHLIGVGSLSYLLSLCFFCIKPVRDRGLIKRKKQ